MAYANGIYMAGGEGEASYAKNSTVQSTVQQRMKPLVEEAMADLCRAAVPSSLRIADLGCSSGPNALAIVSTAIDVVHQHLSRHAAAAQCQELSVFLNDLPGNDFNTVFKEVPSFLQKHKGENCGGGGAGWPLIFVFGVPGSFHGRLFTGKALHFVCSSNSLHWLSQVPQELQNGELVNKGNTRVGRTSTPAVAAAYARQFKNDCRLFLKSRAEEIVPGGRMLVSLVGRPARDFTSDNGYSEFMSSILHHMASRGMIDAEKVDSYNVPLYYPCQEEVLEAIEAEDSFEIVHVESFEVSMGRGAGWARSIRAVHDATMVRHFGAEAGVGDEFVRTATERLERAFGPEVLESQLHFHAVALRRK